MDLPETVAARHLTRCAHVPTVQAVHIAPSRQPESLTNHGARATTSVVIAAHIALDPGPRYVGVDHGSTRQRRHRGRSSTVRSRTGLDLNRTVCARFDRRRGGFGTGYLGSIRSVSQLAELHERAGLISAVYVVSYLAFSIPALVAGVLATHIGLRHTSFGYGCLIALVAFSALTFGRLNARRQNGGAGR